METQNHLFYASSSVFLLFQWEIETSDLDPISTEKEEIKKVTTRDKDSTIQQQGVLQKTLMIMTPIMLGSSFAFKCSFRTLFFHYFFSSWNRLWARKNRESSWVHEYLMNSGRISSSFFGLTSRQQVVRNSVSFFVSWRQCLSLLRLWKERKDVAHASMALPIDAYVILSLDTRFLSTLDSARDATSSLRFNQREIKLQLTLKEGFDKSKKNLVCVHLLSSSSIESCCWLWSHRRVKE
jgi:hypothetical protein